MNTRQISKHVCRIAFLVAIIALVVSFLPAPALAEEGTGSIKVLNSKGENKSFIVVLSDTSFSGDHGVTFSNGVSTEYPLAKGQSITISGLPANTNYTIKEPGENGRVIAKGSTTGGITAGSLWITKNVTVDGQPTDTTLADGNYIFHVKNAEGQTVSDVTVIVTGGKSSTVHKGDLAIGTYTITEDTSGFPAKKSVVGSATQTVTIEGIDLYNPVEFTNDVSTVEPAKVTLKATKSFADWSKAESFTFVLAAVTSDAPMPTNTQATATKASPEAAFDEITFAKAGTWEYTITEKNDGKDGVLYDTTAHKVTVTVAKSDSATNALTASVKYGGADSLTITNTPTYTIEFVNDDGTVLQSEQVAYGETPAYKGEAPTKKASDTCSYEFDAWSPEIVPATANATYKATYKAKATLTFKLAGGKLDGKTDTYTMVAYVGDTVKLPKAPTREGYTFKYWKGSEYKAEAEYKVEGNHTFTAVWEKKATSTAAKKSSTLANTGDPMSFSAVAVFTLSGVTALVASRRHR